MNPVWGHVVGVITVVFMATFLGIWFWAWRKEHKSTFKRMADMPMHDEEHEAALRGDDQA